MDGNRRELLAGLGLLAAAPALAATPAIAAMPAGGFDRRRYDRAIVIDGLTGIDDPDYTEGSFQLGPRGLAQYRESGVTALGITVGEVGNERSNWDKTIANIGLYGRIIASNPQVFTLARTAADIRAAKAAGRIAILYGTQDTAMVGLDLDRLGTLSGLGVRIVQLTYNLRNQSGDGALEPADAGLSKLGRQTIERIEAEKQLLDLSHGGARTIAEALAAAKRPPVISHTGCRSLHDNPRNVWDAELKACADKGGVVGIYWMPFLAADSHAMAVDLVRHMSHAVNVCGEDHVGIGTDGGLSKTIIDDRARAAQAKFFNDRQARGIAAPGEGADVFNIVADLDSHLRYRLLADALAAAGWPSARIEKVLGANLLRLYGEVWGG